MKKLSPEIKGKYGWLNPNDVVFTPDAVARQVIDMFPISGKVLEPCKGEGAFLKYLPPDTEWCEITENRDFFSHNKKVDWIVTNPPYSDFNRFLTHSFELAENVVFLVPLAKIFKSMGTLNEIRKYGGIRKMWLISASKCGFPFGFPAAAVHFQRNYKGPAEIIFADETRTTNVGCGGNKIRK